MILISFYSLASYYFAYERDFIMLSRNYQTISTESCAADIVKMDYRTAAVFKKYGIEYCCGAKWPLKMICENNDLNADHVLQDLQDAIRVVQVSPALPFDDWKVDFLTDYITNVHHQYLRQALPYIKEQLGKFVAEHTSKYPYLPDLENYYNFLYKTMIPHLQQEEEIIFPYVRQIAHAYESKESYASLLVRTLRKPVEDMMHHEHDTLKKVLTRFRTLTNNYTAPENACTSHRVAFSLLQELDDDIVQHLYLENEVLFPKAIAMEKELLQKPV